MVEEPQIDYGEGLSHLSVDDLSRLSVRQAHQLRMQKQNLISKEERLKGLISQFHRHEQKLDSLKHVRATLQSQEARLRDLRQLKQQVDQRTTVKNQLGEELEKIKALFASREAELAESVAKVDILTAQLDRTRNAQQQQSSLSGSSANTSDSPSAALIHAEIERLKQEYRYRLQVVHQQKRKIDEKDTSLLQKTLEKNKINEKINEIAERISKRRGQPDSKIASRSNHTVTYPNPKETLDNPLARQSRESGKGSVNDSYRSSNIQKQTYADQSKMLNGPYVPPEQQRSRDNSQSKVDARAVQKTDSSRPAEIDKEQFSTDSEIVRKSGRSNKEKDDASFASEKPPRFELVLREASNLPNLVTDTLTRDNNDYIRSSETPDTCSSSSDTPSSLSQSLPISNQSPPKSNRHGHVQAIASHGRAVKDEEHGSSEQNHLASGNVTNKRRVKFDPQALLLDASLEGELELVIKTCQQVADPSASNDEGITALHNAICAGHFAIVKFLVEYGCDVNAQDSDGWSPLHCAASCNNLAMCRFLVEHGACIYSTTHSDKETAAQKCEEDEADFEGCSQYLLDTLHNLGRINDGVVYAAYDYQAQNADELSFQCGEQLKVLRTSDDDETEWYWTERPSQISATKDARKSPQVGYIPRNLLALYQRVQRTQRDR